LERPCIIQHLFLLAVAQFIELLKNLESNDSLQLSPVRRRNPVHVSNGNKHDLVSAFLCLVAKVSMELEGAGLAI
jgi:hypothetical protein